MRPRHKSVIAEEIALALAFALLLIGIGATNFAPQQSYRYWLWLTMLIALTGTFIGFLHARHNQRDMRAIMGLLAAQLLHWTAVVIAIICVYLLLGAGRLNYENTGLVMALVLGLGTFLDGLSRVGWRFALLGGLIMLTSIAAAFLEAYVWPLLLLTGLLWLATFTWERRRARANSKN